MKRIVLMLSTVLLVIFVSGMCVFANTETSKADPYDITTWNFHLNKTSFEYNVADIEASKYYGSHDEFATVGVVLSHLKYDAPADSTFGIEVDSDDNVSLSYASFDITGGSYDWKEVGWKIPKGEYTLIITASGKYKGTVEIPFKVTSFKMSKFSLSIWLDDEYNYTYTGKTKTPKCGIGLKYEGEIESLENGKDYTIAYKYKNNKKVGVATVYLTVKFKGNYVGTVSTSKTFKICPKKTKLKSVKGNKKSIKVKWKKRSDVSGYRVRLYDYATDLMWDSYTVKGAKKTSLNMTGLWRHTKYYVTVETYKTVKGKKIYSEDLAYKAVRTH